MQIKRPELDVDLIYSTSYAMLALSVYNLYVALLLVYTYI